MRMEYITTRPRCNKVIDYNPNENNSPRYDKNPSDNNNKINNEIYRYIYKSNHIQRQVRIDNNNNSSNYMVTNYNKNKKDYSR